MAIRIVGALTAFGALAVVLFMLAGGFSVAGLKELSSTVQNWATIVIFLVILGAVLSIARSFR